MFLIDLAIRLAIVVSILKVIDMVESKTTMNKVHKDAVLMDRTFWAYKASRIRASRHRVAENIFGITMRVNNEAVVSEVQRQNLAAVHEEFLMASAQKDTERVMVLVDWIKGFEIFKGELPIMTDAQLRNEAFAWA